MAKTGMGQAWELGEGTRGRHPWRHRYRARLLLEGPRRALRALGVGGPPQGAQSSCSGGDGGTSC